MNIGIGDNANGSSTLTSGFQNLTILSSILCVLCAPTGTAQFSSTTEHKINKGDKTNFRDVCLVFL